MNYPKWILHWFLQCWCASCAQQRLSSQLQENWVLRADIRFYLQPELLSWQIQVLQIESTHAPRQKPEDGARIVTRVFHTPSQCLSLRNQSLVSNSEVVELLGAVGEAQS
jgi:hypothetical protein